MSGRISVRNSVLAAMIGQARLHLPEECCGLLAGDAGVVTEIFPASNALASPFEYFIDPAELIRALRTMREQGLKHLGIYHSHPASENFPSSRDVQMAFYPSCAFFIVSPCAMVCLQVRAFSIQNGQVSEIAIHSVSG